MDRILSELMYCGGVVGWELLLHQQCSVGKGVGGVGGGELLLHQQCSVGKGVGGVGVGGGVATSHKLRNWSIVSELRTLCDTG